MLHELLSLYLKDIEKALQKLEGAGYILLSVPVESLEEVLQEISPHVQSDQVVMDITSTKEHPVALMHRYVKKGRVLGAHPLFGPGAANITNKNVVLTPTDDEEKTLAGKITAFLESKGARVSLSAQRRASRRHRQQRYV